MGFRAQGSEFEVWGLGVRVRVRVRPREASKQSKATRAGLDCVYSANARVKDFG